MARRQRANPADQSWLVDQLAKSTFFHKKLHEWELLEVAQHIEQVRGEQLDWNLKRLHISKSAWNKVIHSGIKPVLVFAHPEVLQSVVRAVSYYRMLAMVSQKSMSRIGLPVSDLEGGRLPTPEQAMSIAQHLNTIISRLIESDEMVMLRELDLWRGMAAGAQAQGSWQNAKGEEIETLVKELVKQRIRQVLEVDEHAHNTVKLPDGRIITFGEDPDIVITVDNRPIIAIEIKGGIDPAGALERLGAAIKTLQRVKEENRSCFTILLIRQASITEGVKQDIERSRAIVDSWYTVERFIEDEEVQQQIWQQLGI